MARFFKLAFWKTKTKNRNFFGFSLGLFSVARTLEIKVSDYQVFTFWLGYETDFLIFDFCISFVFSKKT